MINSDKFVSLLGMDELDYNCFDQIDNMLRLPFLKKYALMPDAHVGYTCPIGSVILLDNVVSPSLVSYDIGCGMGCDIFNTNISYIFGYEDGILDELYHRIPVGFNSRDDGLDYSLFRSSSEDKKLNKKVNDRLFVQMGTLGGGNHFIEMGSNREGNLSITIHSGSRNAGHSVASYWMKLSKNVDKHLPNGFLDLNGEYGQAYLDDMNFMMDYALMNRTRMMGIVINVLGLYPKDILTSINETHNHAIVTDDGVLHRKGATPADKGQLGVIPGNMTDGVFITRGLGNEEYLCSASHGAGRKFSRKRAKELIDFEQVKEEMRGITCRLKKGQIDESRGAYKDINMVIERQEGIVVDVVDHITPVISMKG
jgi:tRNA-splicing ligase RtcB (3'-phosphate/5'-hydroxy nucleic acid ligase)